MLQCMRTWGHYLERLRILAVDKDLEKETNILILVQIADFVRVEVLDLGGLIFLTWTVLHASAKEIIRRKFTDWILSADSI